MFGIGEKSFSDITASFNRTIEELQELIVRSESTITDLHVEKSELDKKIDFHASEKKSAENFMSGLNKLIGK